MKVLHIGKYFPPRYGGIETFMSQLMEEQAIQGLDVAALVHADNLQSDSGEYTWQGCRVFEVKSYGQLVFAPVAPGYPYRLIKALRSFKPDILHIHMPNLSVFWLLVFKRFFALQAKIVIHWHADVLGSSPTKPVKFLYPVYKLFETRLLKSADKIIATSPPYLETSKPLKQFMHRCSVVPLGIKLSGFNDTHPKTQTTAALKMCMVGRLVYYKGHYQVLAAIKQLVLKGSNVSLDIIGDGELREQLQNQCVSLGLGERVRWHGGVSEADKVDLLTKMDLLLLPSLERTEAFGVVLLEAATYKLPVLVSDVEGSGMSYVVSHDDNGVICPAGNVDELVNALLKLQNNSYKLKEMGRRNYERLIAMFNIKKVAGSITSLYRNLRQE